MSFNWKNDKEIEITFEEKKLPKSLVYEFKSKDNCSEVFAKLKFLLQKK